MSHGSALKALALASIGGAFVAGCGLFPDALTDRECMTRVMYFESNRSSQDGQIAVGTTVMNRLADPRFPKSVCGVIGQPGQFADGVLTKPMNPRQSARIAEVADAVLAGERHPQVGGAMYFHTAGLSFPYTNMHYVAVAGGNAFYEKLSRREMAERAMAPATTTADIVAGRPPSLPQDLSGSPEAAGVAQADTTFDPVQSAAPE